MRSRGPEQVGEGGESRSDLLRPGHDRELVLNDDIGGEWRTALRQVNSESCEKSGEVSSALPSG